MSQCSDPKSSEAITLRDFFFFEMQTNFFTHIMFASNLIFFVFLGPANNVFQYFSYPPSRKIMAHP